MSKTGRSLIFATTALLLGSNMAMASAAGAPYANTRNGLGETICVEAAYESADLTDITIGYSPHIYFAPFRDHVYVAFEDLRNVFWKLRLPQDYVIDRRIDLNADARDRRGVDIEVRLAVLYPQMVPYIPVFWQTRGKPGSIRPCRVSHHRDGAPLQRMDIWLGPPVVGGDVPKTLECKYGGAGPFAQRRPDLDFDGFVACHHWGIFTHTDYYRGRVGSDPPLVLDCDNGGGTRECTLSFAREGLPIGVKFEHLKEWRTVMERVQSFLSRVLTPQRK